MTPFNWMFLSTLEELRKIIIKKHLINNLIQLHNSGFDGATVFICTFTLRNKNINDAKGSYIRLSDFNGPQNQAPKTLEAIKNKNCGWFYTSNQGSFEKISGNPIGYWATEKIIKMFSENKSLENFASLAKGMDSGKNDLFIRLWYECESHNSNYKLDNSSSTFNNDKWIPYRKGGEFRKWFGNNDYVINWKNNGELVKSFSNSNIRKLLILVLLENVIIRKLLL